MIYAFFLSSSCFRMKKRSHSNFLASIVSNDSPGDCSGEHGRRIAYAGLSTFFGVGVGEGNPCSFRISPKRLQECAQHQFWAGAVYKTKKLGASPDLPSVWPLIQHPYQRFLLFMWSVGARPQQGQYQCRLRFQSYHPKGPSIIHRPRRRDRGTPCIRSR